VGRLLSLLLAALVLVACQNETHAVFSPSPSPSPHTAPTAAILQSSDVPANLTACPGSGPIDVYLSVLIDLDTTLASRDANYWLQLRNGGGTAGAISVFAANPSACKVELGATTSVRALTSLVVQFADEGQADRAWQSGVFGFAPPPAGEVVQGVTRGTSTGLGLSSFVFDRPSVRLACWRRSVFVALVVASNMDVASLKAATAAIDPRLN